jgi:ribosome-associated protein
MQVVMWCKQGRISRETNEMIEIDGHIAIAENELMFKASRSSGPGGQNVNKLNTRITLLFHVRDSSGLSSDQKSRVLSRLATRIDKEGVLRIVSQKFRTQDANRRAAIERLQQLLAEALKLTPIRKKTRATAGARERRLSRKRHRGIVKRERTGRDWLTE